MKTKTKKSHKDIQPKLAKAVLAVPAFPKFNMTKIKIDVTAVDIRRGSKVHSRKCPVALAMRRRGFKYARVFIQKTEPRAAWIVIDVRSQTSIDAPRSVDRFVKRFDAGKPVQPFSFFIIT